MYHLYIIHNLVKTNQISTLHMISTWLFNCNKRSFLVLLPNLSTYVTVFVLLLTPSCLFLIIIMMNLKSTKLAGDL